MSLFTSFQTLPPAVQWHLPLAMAALLLGPVALWSRKGSTLHRSLGRVWVLLMLGAAVSSLFIRSVALPNVAGFSPIHLLSLAVLIQLPMGVRAALQGRIQAHRKTMRGLYIGGCLVAGAFTLLPGRALGQLLWGQALGWL